MRSLNYSFPLIIGLVLLLAGEVVSAQTNTSAQDTLNRLDEQGRKQGWWLVVGPLPEWPGYEAGEPIEEGRYYDNRRTGKWKRYWPNGKLKSEINYVKGMPRGEYVLYYPNGKPEEKGTWDLDRNTGEFKRWHANGNVAQDFIFDSYGTRDGQQKYYHENGRLAVDVNIVKGREEGTLKRYYTNGELQETAVLSAGVADKDLFKSYSPRGPVAEVKPPADAVAAPVKAATETTNSTDFRAEGYNTLYDNQHRLSQQGQYRKGRLWNGKVYKYDRNGILYKIEVYMDGRYVGKAQLTEDDL
ncbi:MAG: toxin-antitoxin system YwqK family antitoxin [Flavobacteriales bacterium]|nr:toxin-antitoxin system YwqK family antitoxin [Flavobacteriales bacterium]